MWVRLGGSGEGDSAGFCSLNVSCACCMYQSDAHLLCKSSGEAFAALGKPQPPQNSSSAPKLRPQTRQISAGAVISLSNFLRRTGVSQAGSDPGSLTPFPLTSA